MADSKNSLACPDSLRRQYNQEFGPFDSAFAFPRRAIDRGIHRSEDRLGRSLTGGGDAAAQEKIALEYFAHSA